MGLKDNNNHSGTIRQTTVIGLITTVVGRKNIGGRGQEKRNKKEV